MKVDFLKNTPKGKVLLGLSGGPDSLYLFYQLIHRGIPFSAAHVDHGWREESGKEAEGLADLCAAHGVKFYLKTLNPKEINGNLEDACRRMRLTFFQELMAHGYEALVLGHQADDQEETVLKRVFEGAGLHALGAMREISSFGGMTIWRPLLGVKKRDILLWHEQNGKRPFDDYTNRDTKYLRPRLRSQLLPLLAEQFGKEIGESLRSVAKEAAELGDYMETRCPVKEVPGVFGTYADLSRLSHPFELQYAIKKFSRITLSRGELETAVRFLHQKAANKKINQKLYIDRGIVFFLEDRRGEWRLTLESGESHRYPDWREMWEGNAEAALPQGEYSLGPPCPSLDKWWTNHKVPAFLRGKVPVLWKEGQVAGEFLTGKRLNRNFEKRYCNLCTTVAKVKFLGD